MKHLDLTVFEPGDTVGTMSADGNVALWTITPLGGLVRADARLFGNVNGLTAEDPIEQLELTVRTYNILKRESVHTVGDLLEFYHQNGDDDLAGFRNMTKKNIDEIKDWVTQLRGKEGQ